MIEGRLKETALGRSSEDRLFMELPEEDLEALRALAIDSRQARSVRPCTWEAIKRSRGVLFVCSDTFFVS